LARFYGRRGEEGSEGFVDGSTFNLEDTHRRN
jgi:hypothetical protein